MASHRFTKVCLLFSLLLVGMAFGQLSSTFYDKSIPKALSTIKSAVVSAVRKAAIYGNRLWFYACVFVGVCVMIESVAIGK
jgi:hypothetical protein